MLKPRWIKLLGYGMMNWHYRLYDDGVDGLRILNYANNKDYNIKNMSM